MTLETQIQTLTAMSVPELAARYQESFGTPPRSRNPAWLRKRIAFRLQENAFGGLTRTAKAAIDALLPTIDLSRTSPALPANKATKPTPRTGAILRRVWRDTEILVEVLDDGFAWNGTHYTSLSAVAFAVTGTKWNGRLFFGLVGRSA